MSNISGTGVPSVLTCVAASRLLAEAHQLKERPVDNCEAFPQEDNILKWIAVLNGPPGSLYEKGVFFCEMTFGMDYPYSVPNITFLTRISHHAIDEKGRVNLPLLDRWRPCFNVADVLEALSDLLHERPVQINNLNNFEIAAREWTKRYAA